MRVGRIPYINCYPVYGAIDRGLVTLNGTLVDGVPSALNAQMAAGTLDVSVVSAMEYARDSRRYLLLPDLAISCDGPVRSVLLFAKRPASELGGRRVIVSRSSMTSVALVELLFEHVWRAHPEFVPGNSELADLARFDEEEHDARLVIGDAALTLDQGVRADGSSERTPYPFVYDLGNESHGVARLGASAPRRAGDAGLTRDRRRLRPLHGVFRRSRLRSWLRTPRRVDGILPAIGRRRPRS